MSSTIKESTIDRFAGLSDRSLAGFLTRIESPDLENVDLHSRSLTRSLGYRRLHTSPFRNSSIALDGKNDHLRIPYHLDDRYQPSNRLFVSIDLVLRSRPSSATPDVILQRGYGSGANLFFSLQYDRTINTNAGGWRLQVYDATAATLRDITINDGDGNTSPVDLYRHIEFVWSGTSNTYNFTVRDRTSTIGSTTTTVTTFATSTEDWTVGVGMSGAGTLGTAYSSVTVAELRIGDLATVPTSSGVVSRELTPTEYGELTGYWRLNDGNGTRFTDLAGSNPAIAGNEGPTWATDTTKVLGRSGLRFAGDGGFAFITAYWATGVFTATSVTGYDAYRGWSVSLLYTPELAPGETTVRDQTLLWSGFNATDPQPLGIRVVSDQIVAYYQDGTNTKSMAVVAALSSLVGQRLRINVSLGTDTSLAEVFQATVFTPTVGTSYWSAQTATDGADPANVSVFWSLGAKVTATTTGSVTGVSTPTAVERSAYGYIDDFRVIDANSQTAAPPILSTFFGSTHQELQDSGLSGGNALFFGISNRVVYYLRMNEGWGNLMTPVGYGVNSTLPLAVIFPEEDDGIRFDVGLVDTYEPVEILLIHPYGILNPQGSSVNFALVIAGTTLYTVDIDDGTVTAVGGDFHRPLEGGRWVAEQYGDIVYFAAPNGKRPRKWRGASVFYMGIRAPVHNVYPVMATTGGSLADGVYTFYVTYRNAETGAESSPSPPTDATLTGGGGSGKVDSITVPVSSDPQVNQRRIWMTAAGGGAGSTAYLVVTIDDNTTTSWTTDVTALNLAATTLNYNRRDEPPACSIVTVHQDRAIVGGNVEYPTRWWYTDPGVQEGFDQDTRYEDADLDSGDPITAIEPHVSQVLVHLRDGKVGYLGTGDDAVPWIRTDRTRDHGAVAPTAVYTLGEIQYYVGERDFYAWDGSREANLSSPLGDDRPSVETYVRERISPSYRRNTVLAANRKKNRMIWAHTQVGETRNSHALIFSYDQGVWTVRDWPLDYVAEVENGDDDPILLGGIRGFLCRLDIGNADGHADAAATVSGTVASGTTTTLVDSTKSWTVDAYKDLKAHWTDASSGNVLSAWILSNTATTLTFRTTVTAPAAGASYVIGGIPYHADFFLDHNYPHRLKKLRRVYISAAGGPSSLNLKFAPNRSQAVPTFTQTYPTTIGEDNLGHVQVGGLGRHFYMRLDKDFPVIEDPVEIFQIVVQAEEVAAV